MKALLIPTDGNPTPLDIPEDDTGSTLHALQDAVGGLIEPFDVLFGPDITLYVNEEGLADGLRPNRAIHATRDMERAGYLSQMDYRTRVREGDLYAILAGPIVALGFDRRNGRNRSLTPAQADRVTDYFTRISRPGSGMAAAIDIALAADADR